MQHTTLLTAALAGALIGLTSCGRSQTISQESLTAAEDSLTQASAPADSIVPEDPAPAAEAAETLVPEAAHVVDDPLAETYIGTYYVGGGHSGYAVRVYKTAQGVMADLRGQDCYGTEYSTLRMKAHSIDGGIIMEKGSESHTLCGPDETDNYYFDDEGVTKM